jgi:hypothetical protein
MLKGFIFRLILTGAFMALAAFGFCSSALAGDISWSGLYRFEALKLHDAQLDSTRGPDKGYLLHHLTLMPKIVASDSVSIYTRFDILNNNFGGGNYAGQTFGGDPINTNVGANSGSSSATNGNSNVFSSDQNGNPVVVSEVYATWVNEFGVLVVGRAPLQFGLGITYNAGNGLFDHYLTTRDMIGYKIVFGNFFVMPMIGKSRENILDLQDEVNDYMLQVQYENPDSDLSLGGFVQLRTATANGNDAPAGALNPANSSASAPIPPYGGIGGTGAVQTGGFKSQSVNVFVKDKAGPVHIGIEAGLISGKTGFASAAGQPETKISAFGVAAEVAYAPAQSGWSILGKLGTASGDDPSSTASYGSFSFNRNYNVGLILFNHPLGQADFLRTFATRNVTPVTAGQPTTHTASGELDTESVSNAIYFSPHAEYKFNDKISAGSTFVWAMLHRDALMSTVTGQSKNLGYELDFNFDYKPYERLTWLTEVGMFAPGDAFRGGSQKYAAGFVYALSTKAAISF